MVNLPLNVSIIITNYNYARFLKTAIDSALAQTYPLVEVIVVDDGSTDHSRAIIDSYGNRIKAIFKTNGGLASSFNAGVAASAGDVICFLDADDRFLPEKAAQLIDAYERNPEIEWCFHPLRRENESDEVIGSTPGHRPGVIDLRRSIRAGSIVRLSPPTTGLSFRKNLLQKITPMPEIKGSALDDNFLKICAYHLAAGYFIDTPLAVQRIHGSNAFSLNPRNKMDRGRRSVAAAFWIRARFPETRLYTNKLLAKGIAFFRQSDGIDPQYLPLIESYFNAASALERLSIHWLAFLYFLIRRKDI